MCIALAEIGALCFNVKVPPDCCVYDDMRLEIMLQNSFLNFSPRKLIHCYGKFKCAFMSRYIFQAPARGHLMHCRGRLSRLSYTPGFTAFQLLIIKHKC